MTYENYMELYEAVYFFNRIHRGANLSTLKPEYTEAVQALGIHESVYNAVLKILVVNELLEFDGGHYRTSPETIEKLHHIQNQIINQDPNKQSIALFDKAIDKTQFFFSNLSDLEYDIYSRCDYEVTMNLGNAVAKYIDLNGSSVLELGGNSGGLGTALLRQNENCAYTVVDMPIPCKVGRGLNQTLKQNLQFIESDVFDLKLPNGTYDHMLAVNLLHDFDDAQCLEILKNCTQYANAETQFTIVEDILASDFEPKDVIMHGLRLAVECRGGKQRTAAELSDLFSQIGYTLKKTTKVDTVHSLLTFGVSF